MNHFHVFPGRARAWTRAFALVLLCTGSVPHAQATVTCPPPAIDEVSAYFSLWRGTLGSQAIQVILQAHAEDAGRVQGSYTLGDTPRHRILLAGEPSEDGTQLDLEESANGEDVTGTLTLAFPQQAAEAVACRRTLSGEWVDDQYSHPRPIQLERIIAW